MNREKNNDGFHKKLYSGEFKNLNDAHLNGGKKLVEDLFQHYLK